MYLVDLVRGPRVVDQMMLCFGLSFLGLFWFALLDSVLAWIDVVVMMWWSRSVPLRDLLAIDVR